MNATMDTVRAWLEENDLLQTMKRIGALMFCNDPVFTDSATTLDDCLNRARALTPEGATPYTTSFLAEVKDIYEHFDGYEQLDQLLGDARSKEVLACLMMFRLTRDDTYLLQAYCPEDRQYFAEAFMAYDPHGVFADCGALDGATTLEYMLHVPGFKRAYVYEPMEAMYHECVRNLSIASDRVVVRQRAVMDRERTVSFDPCVEGSSRVSETGVSVRATSLDIDIDEPVSMIKMDIEGSEQAAILGAKKHIVEDQPVLAISVYHLPEDMRVIPGMIRGLSSGYRFLLRHHMFNTNETILYALPDRLPVNAPAPTEDAPKALATLLVKEFSRVLQTAQGYASFLVSQNKQINRDTAAAVRAYQAWLENEKEATAYYRQQYEAEKESREYLQRQWEARAEKGWPNGVDN